MNFTHSDNEFHPPGRFSITFQQPFPLFCHLQQNALKNQKESETLKKLTNSQKPLFSCTIVTYVISVADFIYSTKRFFFGFNSTEVRLCLPIFSFRASLNICFNSTEVRLCPLSCTLPVLRNRVSILQKYDYAFLLEEIVCIFNRFNSTEVRLCRNQVNNEMIILIGFNSTKVRL